MRRARVISLFVVLVLLAGIVSPTGTSAQSDIELARQSGLASLADLVMDYPQWQGADLVNGQPYHDLGDQVNVYVFEINKANKALGHMIIGNSAYDYGMLEAGTALPPTVPETEEVQKALERDLGIQVRKEAMGKPRLVYLGYECYFAMYQVDGQPVLFNMRLERAERVSADLKVHLASPEQYKADKARKRDDVSAQAALAASRILDVPIRYMADGCIPTELRNNNNCAPTSGAMIVGFYKNTRGYANFDSWCADHNRLYNTMGTNGGIIGGTYPWNIGPGWTAYASEKGYSFGTTYYGPSLEDWNLLKSYIDASQPVIVMFWGGSPYTNWHACAIKGYNSDPQRIVINDPWGFETTLDWAAHYGWVTIHWLWPQ